MITTSTPTKVEQERIAKTIDDAKERLRKARSESLVRNNQKAKAQRGY